MSALLYMVAILACSMAGKIIDKKACGEINGMYTMIRYNACGLLLSAAIAFVILVLTGQMPKIDFATVLISLFFGVSIAGSIMCNIYALNEGSISLCSLFASAGVVVPSVAGVILFGIPVSIGQWGGIALLLVSSYLMISASQKTYKRLTLKTFLILIALLLTCGCAMIAMQFFSEYVADGNIALFLFLAFGMVGAALFLISLFMRGGTREALGKKLKIYSVFFAVEIFLGYQFSTIAVAFVPPAILFTFANGGSAVLSAAVGAVMYKENVTLRSCLGIALGVVSLVIIKFM